MDYNFKHAPKIMLYKSQLQLNFLGSAYSTEGIYLETLILWPLQTIFLHQLKNNALLMTMEFGVTTDAPQKAFNICTINVCNDVNLKIITCPYCIASLSQRLR